MAAARAGDAGTSQAGPSRRNPDLAESSRLFLLVIQGVRRGHAVRNLMLAWQPAAVTAAGLASVALPAKLYRRRRWAAAAGGVAWETALLFGLYSLWQLAGSFAVGSPGHALPRGRSIWHVERILDLPSETAVQHLILPHPLLVQLANLYYDVLHFPVLIGCLVWLYFWRREHYAPIRTTLVLVTGASLVAQLVLPVAPPRLIGGTGLVDTALTYHQSVYGSLGLDAAQFSAMPSVHVAWAVIVALAVITATRSRWRWPAIGYPVLTTLVVVVTANHYWLDGAVALGLVILAVAIQTLIRRIRAHGVPDVPELPQSELARRLSRNGTSYPSGKRSPFTLAVLSRITTSPGTRITRGAVSCADNTSSAARAPISSSGSRTVVSDGVRSCSGVMSSNPATDMSAGTAIPCSRSAAIAPIAITSLIAKTQVALVPLAISSFADS